MGRGRGKGLVSQMSAGYGQKLFVDGEAVLLLRQDRQFNKTQLQPAGLLGDMAGHNRHIKALPQLGSHPHSESIAVGMVAGPDKSVRTLSADARVISHSSLNANSMGLPCGD